MLKKIKICFFFLSFFWLISISAKTITLEDAERIALEENKELNALIELSNASFERAQEIVSRYMPQATFQGAYYKSEEKIALLPGFPPQDNFWTTGFQFSQLILSKKLYHEIKSGKFDYEAMKYEVENFKNDLLYQVRVAYWEAVLNKEDIRIQEENIKLLQESLAQEEMKEAAGKSAIYQVTQSKVAVANSRSSYFTAQRDYRRSLNNLKQTLGIDPNSEIEVADDTIKLGPLENYFIQDPCYWQKEAYENNPNLKRQAYEVYSHNELKKSHQGEYLPEISTLASYQQQFIPATKFTNQNYTWVGGFYLYWNLFDGFGRESRIRQ
ncbi:MAG: TolC family protein, partial [Parachlamydiaceae bacterium]